MSEPSVTPNRWRNPVFVFVFVPGACAWLTVVGWLAWMYFNPVTDWIGRQNAALQEVLETALWVGWALVIAFGIAAVGICAERAAGIPTSRAFKQTYGRGATWRRPN